MRDYYHSVEVKWSMIDGGEASSDRRVEPGGERRLLESKGEVELTQCSD
jgi:hypothetical protein